MIRFYSDHIRYFDRNGKEITDGCTIRYTNGKTAKVCLTADGRLGTDATNPVWIARGRAVPYEFGVYPLSINETDSCEVIS